MGEGLCAVGAARDEGVEDRAVLVHVLSIEVVDLGPARAPAAQERPSRALGDLLDERDVGRLVDDVVEVVVRAHPVDCQPCPLALAPTAVEQLVRQLLELRLGRGQLVEPGRGHVRRRETGHERLELGADEERLAKLVE